MKLRRTYYIELLRKKSLSKLRKEDIRFLKKMGIINGCGGSGCRIQQLLATAIAGIFAEASCEAHDFVYWKGGTEARRKECDWKFLQAMRRDIKKQALITRPYYHIVAWLFYISVRIGGKKYFNYTKNGSQ